MSEPKFTQGEWTRNGQFQTFAGDFRLLYDCKPINVTVPADEAAANAALIAGAPEMYDWRNWLIEMDLTVASPNDKEKIKNVLKKARGEA